MKTGNGSKRSSRERAGAELEVADGKQSPGQGYEMPWRAERTPSRSLSTQFLEALAYTGCPA